MARRSQGWWVERAPDLGGVPQGRPGVRAERSSTGLFPTLCTPPPVRRARTRRSCKPRLRRRSRVSRPLLRPLQREQPPRPELARTRHMLLLKGAGKGADLLPLSRPWELPERGRLPVQPRQGALQESSRGEEGRTRPLPRERARGREVARRKPKRSLRLRPKARRSHQAPFAPFSPRTGRARKEPAVALRCLHVKSLRRNQCPNRQLRRPGGRPGRRRTGRGAARAPVEQGRAGQVRHLG